MNNSIYNMTKILDVILNEAPTRLKDISTRTDLTNSNAHKIIKSMESCGYVTRDPINKTYLPGPWLVSKTQKISESHDILRICANDEMIKMRNFSKETVGIFMRLGAQRVVVLEVVYGNNFFVTMKGINAPIYTGASGYLLLSNLSDKQVNKLLDNTDIIALGPNTITDREALFEKLKTTRKQGYSVSTGTVTRKQLITGLAFPITNYPIPLALSIYGHKDSFEQKIPNCIDFARNVANRISWKLASYFSNRAEVVEPQE